MFLRKIILVVGVLIFGIIFTYAEGEGEDDALGKRYTISGQVKDGQNGEALIGVTVFVKEASTGTVSNTYGFYSISLLPGEYTLVYSYIGYEPIEKQIALNKNYTLNLELSEDVKEIDEVVIRSERRDANVNKAEMSVTKLQMKNIRKIPALMGEVDVIKAIQMLPGVHSTMEGGSGFSVRGGSADQNLILLDEATVYNASHMMGFFSVFNNDAIKDIKLYKGDIPASSGGRLSSLLDVRMKDGNSKKFAATGGIGTISSRLTIEGPIIKDNTSFIASGRRTYADLFLPFAKDKDVRDSKLYFYDFNLKVNHRINENNRVYASGYFGQDVFKNSFAKLGFGNNTQTLRWNHLFSKRIFMNFSVIRSEYDYYMGTNGSTENGFIWESSMEEYATKLDFNYYLNPNNTIEYGIISSYHVFDPGMAKGIGDQTLFTEYIMPKNYALEHGAYASNEQVISDKLTLKYGLRFSAFQNIGKGTIYNFDDEYVSIDSTVYPSGEIFNTYYGFEPRLGIKYSIDDRSSVKASYSRTRQYVHLASNSTGGTPLDIWFPSSPNVKPQIADQVAIGYFRNLFNNSVETSVEFYYKEMDNTIDFKDHAMLLLNKELEGELRFGTAHSYGAELLIKIPDGRLNGWISYTYSKTVRKIPEINNGRIYSAPYDKPHDISIVLNYQVSKRSTVSANWVYSTGSPVTLPVGGYWVDNTFLPLYSDRNSYRLRDYHRLDLAYSLEGKKKPGRLWQGEWVFSVYNAYMRKNIWALNFEEDPETGERYAEMTYLFSIIPSITYNFKF